MGIVVTIFMLLGLLQLPPLANLKKNAFATTGKNVDWIGFGLLIAGAWNALWHGLRHLQSFWGMAGLVSGIFMMLAAILLLSRSDSALSNNAVVISLSKLFKPLSIVIIIGLAASFLLYAVTLIRLNLGLPIIH